MPKVSLLELAQHPELHCLPWRRKGKPVCEGEAGGGPVKTGLNRLEPGTDLEALDV